MWLFLTAFCIFFSGLHAHVTIHPNEDSASHQQVASSTPLPPTVILVATSIRSLTFKISPNANSSEPVSEYKIYFKAEFGEWETIQKKNIADYYTIEDLYCGTSYEVYVVPINSLGAGDKSDTISAKTSGGKPQIPRADKLIEASSNYANLYLNTWFDKGCPIIFLVIEYKKKSSSEWILVTNRADSSKTRLLPDLEPLTPYNLRVTAHNSAGFTTAEYKFVTLAVPKNGSIAHQPVVNSTPLTPQVILVATSTRSLTFKIAPNPNDTVPITEYKIFFKAENGEWERIQKINIADYYTLEDLYCGTLYSVYVVPINSLGTGNKTDIISAKTSGGKPQIPSAEKLIEASYNYVNLYLNTWPDGGCLMLYLVVEYKKKSSSEWTLVSNNADLKESLLLPDLEPSTSYNLRITAHNSAGFTTAKYEFVTLALPRGLLPHEAKNSNEDSVTQQPVVNSVPLSPQVILIATSIRSLTFKIVPNPNSSQPVSEYKIYFKAEYGEWETIQKKNVADYYTIEDLYCGTSYEVYVVPINILGAGEKTDIIKAKTSGGKPEIPSENKFIEASSNYVILHLNAWSDGGCPIVFLVVEYKKNSSSEWILVTSRADSSKTWILLDLEPSTSYNLRVTAHNSAGSTTAEYTFVTLTASKGVMSEEVS